MAKKKLEQENLLGTAHYLRKKDLRKVLQLMLVFVSIAVQSFLLR
ncbi:hypothetical protein [Guptibacillus hwajinpoensis]